MIIIINILRFFSNISRIIRQLEFLISIVFSHLFSYFNSINNFSATRWKHFCWIISLNKLNFFLTIFFQQIDCDQQVCTKVQKNFQNYRLKINSIMHTYIFFHLPTSDHSHASHSPPKRVPPGSPDRASARWSWSNLKHNRVEN